MVGAEKDRKFVVILFSFSFWQSFSSIHQLSEHVSFRNSDNRSRSDKSSLVGQRTDVTGSILLAGALVFFFLECRHNRPSENTLLN